jgi:phospholipase C
LPSYSFIEPRFNDWYDESTDQNFVANDQHPDNNVQAGEQLIADVYEAVRASKYWANSLLVIVYDEHGGLYDHVPPPGGVASVDPSADFDFTRLGLRVPAVFISPYIKAGTISHSQFEHSSLAATSSALFAPTLTPITARAAQAKPFHNILNLDKPRDDAPMKLDRSVNVFQSDSNSHGQGSLNEHQMMQLLAAYHFDSLQPPDKRVLGRGDFVSQRTLQDLDTEQVAAKYIKAVAAQASPAAFGAKA